MIRVVAAGGAALLGLLRRGAAELAHLGRHGRAERSRLGLEDLPGPAQHLGAFGDRPPAPEPERGRRRRQLAVDRRRRVRLERAQPLAGGGIDTFDRHGPNVTHD